MPTQHSAGAAIQAPEIPVEDTVLVTGGSGFVGGHAIVGLLNRGYRGPGDYPAQTVTPTLYCSICMATMTGVSPRAFTPWVKRALPAGSNVMLVEHPATSCRWLGPPRYHD